MIPTGQCQLCPFRQHLELGDGKMDGRIYCAFMAGFPPPSGCSEMRALLELAEAALFEAKRGTATTYIQDAALKFRGRLNHTEEGTK